MADYGRFWFSQLRTSVLKTLRTEIVTRRLKDLGCYSQEMRTYGIEMRRRQDGCEICLQDETPATVSKMLICDGCYCCYHLDCLGLPRDFEPPDEYEWFCYQCERLANRVFKNPLRDEGMGLSKSHTFYTSQEDVACRHQAGVSRLAPPPATGGIIAYGSVSLRTTDGPLQYLKPCKECFRKQKGLFSIADIGIFCRARQAHITPNFDMAFPIPQQLFFKQLLSCVGEGLIDCETRHVALERKISMLQEQLAAAVQQPQQPCSHNCNKRPRDLNCSEILNRRDTQHNLLPTDCLESTTISSSSPSSHDVASPQLFYKNTTTQSRSHLSPNDRRLKLIDRTTKAANNSSSHCALAVTSSNSSLRVNSVVVDHNLHQRGLGDGNCGGSSGTTSISSDGSSYSSNRVSARTVVSSVLLKAAVMQNVAESECVCNNNRGSMGCRSNCTTTVVSDDKYKDHSMITMVTTDSSSPSSSNASSDSSFSLSPIAQPSLLAAASAAKTAVVGNGSDNGSILNGNRRGRGKRLPSTYNHSSSKISSSGRDKLEGSIAAAGAGAAAAAATSQFPQEEQKMQGGNGNLETTSNKTVAEKMYEEAITLQPWCEGITWNKNQNLWVCRCWRQDGSMAMTPILPSSSQEGEVQGAYEYAKKIRRNSYAEFLTRQAMTLPRVKGLRWSKLEMKFYVKCRGWCTSMSAAKAGVTSAYRRAIEWLESKQGKRVRGNQGCGVGGSSYRRRRLRGSAAAATKARRRHRRQSEVRETQSIIDESAECHDEDFNGNDRLVICDDNKFENNTLANENGVTKCRHPSLGVDEEEEEIGALDQKTLMIASSSSSAFLKAQQQQQHSVQCNSFPHGFNNNESTKTSLLDQKTTTSLSEKTAAAAAATATPSRGFQGSSSSHRSNLSIGISDSILSKSSGTKMAALSLSRCCQGARRRRSGGRSTRRRRATTVEENLSSKELEMIVDRLPYREGLKWYASKKGFNAFCRGKSKWFSAPSRGVLTAYRMATEWLDTHGANSLEVCPRADEEADVLLMAKNENGNIAAEAPPPPPPPLVKRDVKNEEKVTGEVGEYEKETTRNFSFFGNDDKNETAKENNTYINIEETEKENAVCGGDEEINVLSGFEGSEATIQTLIDHFRPFPRFISWNLRKKSFAVSHINHCHQRTTCTFPLAKYADVKKAFESAVKFNNEVNKERLNYRNERLRQKEDIQIEDGAGTLRRTTAKDERTFSVNVKDGKKIYNEEESDGSSHDEDHHQQADSRECRDKGTKNVETTARLEDEAYDERVFEPSTPTTPTTTTESIEPLVDDTISSTSSFSKTTLTSLCHQTHQRINYADITPCPLSGGGGGGVDGPVQSKSSTISTSSSSSVDVMPTTTSATTVLSSSSSSFLSEETGGGDEQLLTRNLEDSGGGGGKENQSGNRVVSSFPCEMTTIASTLKPQLPGVRWVAAPYFWWEVNKLAGGGDRRRFPVKRFGGDVREAFEAANQFALLHRHNRVEETTRTTTTTTTSSTDNEWMAASTTTTAAAALMATTPGDAVVAVAQADRGEAAVATNCRNSSRHVVEDDDIPLRCWEAEPTNNSNSSSNSKGKKTKISEELSLHPINSNNSLDPQCLTMQRKVRKSTRIQKEEKKKKTLSGTEPPVTPAAFLFSPSPHHPSLDSFCSTSCRTTTTVCATRESSKAFQQAAANALHPWRDEVRWEASRSRWRVRYTRPLVPLVVVSENGGGRGGGDKQIEKSEDEGGEDGGREGGGGGQEEVMKVKYNNGKEDKPKTFLKYFSLSRYDSVEEAYEKAVAFVKQMKRLNHRGNYLANEEEEEEALLRSSSSSSSSPTTSIIKTAAVVTNATSESIVATDVDVNKMPIKNTEKEEDDESRSGRLATTDDNLSLALPPPLSPTSVAPSSSLLKLPACTAMTTTILSSSSTSTTMALGNFSSTAAAAVFPRKRSSSSTLLPGVCGGAVVPTVSGGSRTGNNSCNSTTSSSNSTSSTFPTPTMTTMTINNPSSTEVTANGHCGGGGGGGDLLPISRMIELCGGGREKRLSLDNSGDARIRSPNTTITNNIQQQQQTSNNLLLPMPNVSPKPNEAVQSQTKEVTSRTSPSVITPASAAAAAMEIKKNMKYDVNEGDDENVITDHREDIKIRYCYNDDEDVNGVDNEEEGGDGKYKSDDDDDGEEEEEEEDGRLEEKSSRRPERKSAVKAKQEQQLLLLSMQDEEDDDSQEEGEEDSSVSSFSSFSSSSQQSEDDDDFPISSNSSTLCPTHPDYYSSSALPPPPPPRTTSSSSSVFYRLPAAASPLLPDEEYIPLHEIRHLKRLKTSTGKAKTTEEKEENIIEEEQEEEEKKLEEDEQRIQQLKYKGGGGAATFEMQQNSNSSKKRIKQILERHHRDYEKIDGFRSFSGSSSCSCSSSTSSSSSSISSSSSTRSSSSSTSSSSSSSTRSSSGSTISATTNNNSFSANSSTTIIPTTRCSSSSSSSSIGNSSVFQENEETRGTNSSNAKELQELENLILNISRMNREALDAAKKHPPFFNPP